MGGKKWGLKIAIKNVSLHAHRIDSRKSRHQKGCVFFQKDRFKIKSYSFAVSDVIIDLIKLNVFACRKRKVCRKKQLAKGTKLSLFSLAIILDFLCTFDCDCGEDFAFFLLLIFFLEE